MSEFNPFAAPSEFGDIAKPSGIVYGGIGRLAYFGFGILAYIALLAISFVVGYAGGENVMPLLVVIVISYYVTVIYLLVQRLVNLGYSGWWVLGIIVPFLNLLIALRCLAAPEGYAHHKKLDTTGNIIAGLIIGTVVLAIIAVIVAGAMR